MRDNRARMLAQMQEWYWAELQAAQHWTYDLERVCERAHQKCRYLARRACEHVATCLVLLLTLRRHAMCWLRSTTHRAGEVFQHTKVADVFVVVMRFCFRWTMLTVIGIIGGTAAQAVTDITVRSLAKYW